METTYLSIDAKRLSFRGEAWAQKASGGACEVYYTRLPRPAAPGRAGGRVLNLDDYRPAPAAAPPPAPKPAPGPGRRRSRAARIGLVLDFCATGAILALTAGVLLRVFAG